MGRRRDVEEEDKPERWLVSYADFITLLLAFFVVMYAVSSLNEDKYRLLSESLGGVFSPAQPASGPVPAAAPATADEVPTVVADTRPDPLDSIALSMRAAFGPLIDSAQLSLRGGETWLEIELSAGLLFPSGEAMPDEAALALIERIAEILAPWPNPVRVEGFTDNQPIGTARYPSNWELSAARAASVVRLLAERGVDPARLAAVGYGEYQAAASNITVEGRARNRRVVLAIARDPVVRHEPFARQAAQEIGTQAAKRLDIEASSGDLANFPTHP